MAPPLRELPPTGHRRARGLVSCPTSGSRIEAHRYAAPPDLADIVEAWWVGRWDLRGQAPHTTELLGDPCVHIVAESGWSRVVGVWTRRWVRTLEGRGQVRGVKLRAGAVRALFDRPAIELTNTLHGIDPLLPVSTEIFEQTVLGPTSDEVAFAALADLVRRLRHPERMPEVRRAIAAVGRIEDPSIQSVEALAADRGLRVRALQRLFREHVGAPPKVLLRRARLQRAAAHIEHGHRPNLADLAAELGYTDQSHFNRDFRVAVGKTPRQLEQSLKR